MITLTTAEYDALADPPAHQLRVDDVGIVVVEIDDEPPHVALVLECVNVDVDAPAFRLLVRLSPSVATDLQTTLEAAMSHFDQPGRPHPDHPRI
jgi:hypothetical protein